MRKFIHGILSAVLVVSMGIVLPAASASPFEDLADEAKEKKKAAEKAAAKAAKAKKEAQRKLDIAAKAEAARDRLEQEAAEAARRASEAAQSVGAAAGDAVDSAGDAARPKAAFASARVVDAFERAQADVESLADESADSTAAGLADLSARLSDAELKKIMSALSDAVGDALGSVQNFFAGGDEAAKAFLDANRREIDAASVLSAKLGDNSDATVRGIRASIRARDGASAMAGLNKLPEYRNYVSVVSAKSVGAPGGGGDSRDRDYTSAYSDEALGCARNYDNDAFQTLTIALPSVDGAVIVGLGADVIGLAIDMRDHPCTNGDVYYFFSPSYAYGVSLGASGGVGIGSWRGPNWCQSGDSAAKILAFGAGADIAVGVWFASPEARNRYGEERDGSFHASAPQNLWLRETGLSVAASGGVGAELFEHTNAHTFQFPGKTLKNICKEINNVRAEQRTCENGDNRPVCKYDEG